MTSTFFRLGFLTSYFDYDDYTNPIKSYINDFDVFSVFEDRATSMEARIRHNTAEMTDGLLIGLTTEETEFYSLETKTIGTEHHEANTRGMLARVYINLDRISDTYQRRVYTFMDLFGFVGGLFEIMSTCGLYFVSYVADRLYHNSVLSNLYQTEVSEKIKEEKVQSTVGKMLPFGKSQTESEMRYTDPPDNLRAEAWVNMLKNRRKYSLNL